MSRSAKETVETAYELWGEGRIDDIAEFLAPEARWRSIERRDGSVDWCNNREQILETMSRAHKKWSAYISMGRVTEVGEGVVVSLEGVQAEATATFIVVREGTIVLMQDCRDEAEAFVLAGSTARSPRYGPNA